MGAAVLAAKSPETWSGWVDHVDVHSNAVVSTNIDDGRARHADGAANRRGPPLL